MPRSEPAKAPTIYFTKTAERVAGILGWVPKNGVWIRADGTSTGLKVATKESDHFQEGYFRPDRIYAHALPLIKKIIREYNQKHTFKYTRRTYIAKIPAPGMDGEFIEVELDVKYNAHAANEAMCLALITYWEMQKDLENGPREDGAGQEAVDTAGDGPEERTA